MDFEQVAKAVEGVPIIPRERGRELYEHVRRTKPEMALEIGTNRGVSAAYIAAAMQQNRGGHLVTVDHAMTGGLGAPGLLERIGLGELVTCVKVTDSSYNWWLKRQIAERSDQYGNVRPLYDFCFLDGAHHFTIDGLAVVLIEKLLRPGGWLLLDDLDWTYESTGRPRNAQTSEVMYPLSEEERTEPNLRAVYDLIVRQLPGFTYLREDGHWGWAQKSAEGPKRYEKIELRHRRLAPRLRRAARRARRLALRNP